MSNSFILAGRARVFGDDVNTDYIITSRRKRESLDPQVLRQYLFEELNPEFAESIKPDDLLVAGKNFGCGSAMEVAVTVVRAAGIRAVLARSFSRTYYRNAINNGLIPVVCNTQGINEGDPIVLAVHSGGGGLERWIVSNSRTGEQAVADPLPRIMLDILHAGGLVPYFRQHGDFRPTNQEETA
jgi:3-isopropylmalate/(R)-2-methylmalate dehydratase small subunit